MMKRIFIPAIGLAFAVMMGVQSQSAAAPTPEKPLLHPLFTSNMVLQRDMSAPIWGWTAPGQQVTVVMGLKASKAVAGADGKWMAGIGPFPAGGPHTLIVIGPQTVILDNVLVGDVWICSGQSNMEMGIGAINAPQDIAQANTPQIRLFTVPKAIAAEPLRTFNSRSRWLVCTPETVAGGGWGGFSAVAYFFGRHLERELKVPIGLIHTSWGGTVAEAWTSGTALRTMPDFQPAVTQMEAMAAEQKQGSFDFDKKMAEWWTKNDPGSAEGAAWADASFAAAGWKTMNLPTLWEAAGLPDFDGVVWFRKEFEVPESWVGQDLMLHLGPIDDRDTTWINGVKVGGLDSYQTPRDYKIPANVVKPGRNVVAVRVLDTGGGGGIYGKPEEMKLEVAGDSGAAPISLAGPWLYRDSAPLSNMQPAPQRFDDNPNLPTVLYNGMIAPLVPFAIKGAIWYQGESNAGRARQYRTLLPTMIQDWRSRFGVGEFPFFIVQLANFMATKAEPGESAWAELREAQLLTSQRVPKSGIAVATDIGDATDIHPRNKQDVGHRLALAALAVAYGQKIEYSGPVYRALKREGNALRLRFDHTGGGLMAKGDKLQGFAIAGDDKRFVWSDARIDGDTIVVSSPQVPNPVAVRYAWPDNPVANLYNRAGLPASPFRTDMDTP